MMADINPSPFTFLIVKGDVVMSYFRSTKTNPNWFGIFTEQVDMNIDPDDILDEIAKLACGINPASADAVQAYAFHIRTHIEAAFRVGLKVANNRVESDH